MRWQLKAAVQKSLDFLPEASAENVNYALQRRVSRSFPTSKPQFLLHFDQAIEQLLRPFGLIEMARTGEIAIARGRSET